MSFLGFGAWAGCAAIVSPDSLSSSLVLMDVAERLAHRHSDLQEREAKEPSCYDQADHLSRAADHDHG